MKKGIRVKTNRTSSGIATAELSRFPNYSTMKWEYSFSFYRTRKFFDTYKELREYVETNYEMVDYSGNEYHLPENRKEFFK